LTDFAIGRACLDGGGAFWEKESIRVLAAARSFIRAGGPDTLAVFAVRPARADIGGHGGRPSGR
jgi:hypothetical protein